MNSELLDLLLRGKCESLLYGDLEQILQDERIGYKLAGIAGAYRTWKHDSNAKALTVRDEGERPMYHRYVTKAAQHLLAVQAAGGFHGKIDT